MTARNTSLERVNENGSIQSRGERSRSEQSRDGTDFLLGKNRTAQNSTAALGIAHDYDIDEDNNYKLEI
jgi:hypothetical protein